ncbi:MAG: hypothetical protein IKZ06_02730, partial [Oscillospiraceae bacterium]|nr:hypothetical protein [Oscillospiraceae bacterium]
MLKLSITGTPKTAGTYNFSVTFLNAAGNKVATKNYTITVGEKAPFDYIASISLDKWPNKTVYYLGDTVDLTGMKVTAVAYTLDAENRVYVPSVIDITDLCWADPGVFTSDETQDVKICVNLPCDQNGTLKTFTDTFRATFKYANPNEVLRIEVYKKPTKLTYTVGETLDTTGMEVRLHK